MQKTEFWIGENHWVFADFFCLQLRLYDNKNESEEQNMDFDYEESVYLAADLLERMEEMKREAEAEAEETNDEEEQARKI